jgi:hypothetical protein
MPDGKILATDRDHHKQTTNKVRPKTASSRELYSKKNDDALVTDRMALSAELDMFIDGTRFGRKDEPKLRPQNSSSPSPPTRNKTTGSRPSSAGPRVTRSRPSTSIGENSQASTRRSSTGLSSSIKGSLKTQTNDLLRDLHLAGERDESDPEAQRIYDERIKRDLKRTEREMKIKEAALKRQVKKYGVDLDAYDAYHEV